MSEVLILSAEPPNARAAERLAALRELAEIGMRLARAAVAAVEAGEGAGDGALTYSRIARAVRQTLALQARLEDEGETLRRRAETERAKAEAAEVQARSRAEADEAYAPTRERRRLVSRAVDRAMEHDAANGERLDYLKDKLFEVLDDREEDEDFLTLPISEVVAIICKDLNVDFDPDLWADEAWARSEKAAAEKAAAETAAAARLRAGQIQSGQIQARQAPAGRDADMVNIFSGGAEISVCGQPVAAPPEGAQCRVAGRESGAESGPAPPADEIAARPLPLSMESSEEPRRPAGPTGAPNWLSG